MPNFRWGFIAGLCAAVISALLGVVFGVSAVHIFSRALIFMGIFFGVGFGLRFLINSFFPELLYINEEPAEKESFDEPGSRVNIILDNSSEYALPEKYKTDEPQEMGNIEDLISGYFKPRIKEETASMRQESVDRQAEDGYNNGGGDYFSPAGDADNFTFQDEPAAAAAEGEQQKRPEFTPSFGDDSDGLGGLPDLEAMAIAFSSGFSGEPARPAPAHEPAHAAAPAPEPAEQFQPTEDAGMTKYSTGNKPQPLEGDFKPQELAEGIRTILRKEK